MSTLFITEFRGSRNARSALEPVAVLPPLAEQAVAVGAGSVQSAALNAATDLVRVHCDVNCQVSFGANPTAAVGSMRLAAGASEYFGVAAGSALKIAVIAGA